MPRPTHWGPAILALAIITGTLHLVPASPAARGRPQTWFCPGPGTTDYLRLFEQPSEWARTRPLVDVFKFYNQHTLTSAPPIVGPNSYDALVRVDAFRKVRHWGMGTALEIGSVKEFFCEPGSGGMEASVRNTLAGVRAIEQAGGRVDFIAMDEPWVAGRERICGGPALEPVADMVAAYVTGVRSARPGVAIGLIEAYPFSSAPAIERMLDLLTARGVSPAFLHMDVDWHALAPGVFARDLPRLSDAAAARGIPFGIIVVGYDGNADTLYAADAYGIAHLTAAAFEGRDASPQHVIFQSWVESSTGLFITPSNLPDDRPYSHTRLVADISRILRGDGPTGTAIQRRRE